MLLRNRALSEVTQGVHTVRSPAGRAVRLADSRKSAHLARILVACTVLLLVEVRPLLNRLLGRNGLPYHSF